MGLGRPPKVKNFDFKKIKKKQQNKKINIYKQKKHKQIFFLNKKTKNERVHLSYNELKKQLHKPL